MRHQRGSAGEMLRHEFGRGSADIAPPRSHVQAVRAVLKQRINPFGARHLKALDG